MNELTVFNNPEFGQVRTVVIDNMPWFVGKDVAEILGYTDTRHCLLDHIDSDDRKSLKYKAWVKTVPTLWNNPNDFMDKTIINESGMYALIFGSKLPSAKKFKRWVTSEVLPAIRKTGTYSVNTKKQKSALKDIVNYIKTFKEQMTEQGCSSNEIAEATKQVSEQFGIILPDFYVKPRKLTDEEINAMIDHAIARPRGRGHKRLTYEDFVVS